MAFYITSKLLSIARPKIAINPRKPPNSCLCNLIPAAAMSWSCKKCTFLNPPSQKPTCQVCSSPSSPPPSASSSSSPSSVPKWSCKACTFLNSYKNASCEICDTRASLSTMSSFEDLRDTSDGLDSSVGSVFFPLRRCKRKMGDQVAGVGEDCVEVGGIDGGAMDGSEKVDAKEDGKSRPASDSWKILTYNVWFREDLEMHKRTKAIGELVQMHSPHVICFQEVTPNIYDLFRLSSWWKLYHCSVSSDAANLRPYFCMLLSKLPVRSFACKPFGNSVMGRELCTVKVEVEGKKPLTIATSHLESPCPAPPKWDQMYSKERVDQAKEAMDELGKHPNVILGGDMNWDDTLDGRFPLHEEWVDAWEELRPNENGWTYDTKSNSMLSANRTLQKRLDRFLCNLHDFKITSIDMIGREAIPGLTYCKEKKVRKEVKNLVLPVLPSDHFGLLLTIGSK
ncbi:uncharacterized protein LOC115742952 [Rhodamnia argentea]|uniref:Uncharacterized protein LOC115742952 n=1 Tax=Rhodamnia argentea TaxID=178133 RepID=A0A8B8PEZ9_9MYRT|nr:uncharacterized protein LOC115742952 [Rhodamnia argentea]